MRLERLLVAAALTALVATGCGSTADDVQATPKKTSTTLAAPLLARFDLDGMDTVAIIDHLDRLGGDARPTKLTASVRPTELQLASGKEKVTLPIGGDRFYLSVAPYVEGTHECFFHSLTTCKGELGSKELHVRITDDTHHKVLVDETTTTFANGFVGFWLPRDIEGTLRVSYDGRTAQTDIATDADAPTCLTSLKLT